MGIPIKLFPLTHRSMEHVVPKSRIPTGSRWNLHNLLVVDKNVNHFRSNTKFGDKTIHNVSFCPPENKGAVSRICAHMFDECSRIQHELNHDLVINRDLMLQWNEENPVTDIEKYANDYIYNVQGTHSEYVDESLDMNCRF